MSIKTALDHAILTIENYELDIKNSKNEFNIDLEKMGFCQGVVYKYALKIINQKRKEK